MIIVINPFEAVYRISSAVDVMFCFLFFFFLIQGCHCLLDIAPHAIERLHSVHIYPIVVFVRYKNAKQIK